MTGASVVWLSTSATSFSCLCEECLELARGTHMRFPDAVLFARVQGDLAPAVLFMTVECRSGHRLVLRRGEGPAALPPLDEGQLRIDAPPRAGVHA